MEHFAKILGGERVENNKLWKYTFLDIQNNQENWFYYDKQINYKPNLIGKLKLTRDKFFQSFNQEIIENEEKIKQDEILTELEGVIKHKTEKFSNVVQNCWHCG